MFLMNAVLYFATAVCCVILTTISSSSNHQSYYYNQQHQDDVQRGQHHPTPDKMNREQQQEGEKLSLLFLGTAMAHTASVATINKASSSSSSGAVSSKKNNALLTIRSTSSSVTMMAMTAGSRTLIEIGNVHEYDNDEYGNKSNRFQIDVSYVDDDYENGLLILRRANIDDDDDYCKGYYKGLTTEATTINKSTNSKTVTSCKAINSGHYQNQKLFHLINPKVRKVLTSMKNPILASVLIGNVASMIGLLPMGVSGFFPGIAVTIGSMKAKWLIPRRPLMMAVSKTVRSSPVGLRRTIGSFNRFRHKVIKLIAKVYKNRSKYSLLSDYTWYVPKKNKDDDVKNNNDGK